jgi:ribosome-binding factor A
MTSRKISKKSLLSGCSEVGPDDGLDPRYDRPAGSGKVPNRKALQLCSQVAETLAGVLTGELEDDVLRDLLVVSVTPAPNSSRLLVTVRPAPGAPAPDPGDLAERLSRARERLRAEVARAIHRRRVPDLTFRLA